MEEGKKVQYETLRAEMNQADTMCLTILSFLMTTTLTCYGIVIAKSIYLLILLLSGIWAVGYFYISEKRFVIIRIAYFFLTELEDENEYLFWEIWQAKNRENLDKMFPRSDPFFLETIFSISLAAFNSVLLWFVEEPLNTKNIFKSLLVDKIYFMVSLLFLLMIMSSAWKFLHVYKPHAKD